jgi:hypothetical protein
MALPATGLNHVSSAGSNGFTCLFLFPNVDCTGTLPAGQTTILTLVTQVTATAPPDTTVQVTTTVDPANAFTESNEANNEETEVTTVHSNCGTGCIDLVTSPIVASPDPVANGEYATFVIGVGNAGDTNSGTFDISLKLDDPADFDFAPGGFDNSQPSDDYSASADFDCSYPGLGDTVTCTGDLDGGEGVLIVLKVHVKAATHPNLSLEAKADSGTTVTEFSELNNTQNASVGIQP